MLPSDPPQVPSRHIRHTTFSTRLLKFPGALSSASSEARHRVPRKRDLSATTVGCDPRTFGRPAHLIVGVAAAVRFQVSASQLHVANPAVSWFQRIVTVVLIGSRLILLPRFVPSAPTRSNLRALECTYFPLRVPTSVADVGPASGR
jgi:hypothetical protein